MKLKYLLKDKAVLLFFMALALYAVASGFSDGVFSNYFKEAYDVTAAQRGFIEFPRETPGILCVLIIASFGFLGDVRMSVAAQLLCALGIAVLAFSTPSFNVMLIFLFINSLGLHMFFSLQDSIGIRLIKDPSITGKRMGQYSAVTTGFTMVAAFIVFLGFRLDFFSFLTPVKSIFVISAVLFFFVALILIMLSKTLNEPVKTDRKLSFVFRKKYSYYYILSILRGAQKQVALVYGPWVLIDLLSKRADTIAILSIVGSFIGIFFIQAVGRLIDRFGAKTMLFAEAGAFIFIYAAYGVLAMGFADGFLPTTGLPVLIAMLIIILDKMSMQMNMVKAVYLNSILIDKSDMPKTISMGVSLDHAVSIFAGVFGGIVWSTFGPQYIFFFAAILSLGNLWVAWRVGRQEASGRA